MIPRTLPGGAWRWSFVVVATALGCGQAAATFFDFPEDPTPQNSAPESARRVGTGSVAVVAQESAPPPIEAVSTDSALRLLPLDEAGDVDWVAALRTGVIDPRRENSTANAAQLLEAFSYDFVIEGPDEMFNALFPHSAHVEWMACESCHSDIFPFRTNTYTMQTINEGESCGRCHGPVAFPATTCVRCHPAMPAPTPADTPRFRGVSVLARHDSTDSVGMPPSLFPHAPHRIRYRCSSCHPNLYAMRSETDTLTMESLQQGKSCGSCHNDQAAFGLLECNRCHATLERVDKP